ncbi:MAG: phosphoribosylformylglycinamidine synthase subunit PurS [Bryobacteraceae bacterium]|nr:phosphoribosylformylglycinamidine synthase subunit PurS [Bryobacteraceae bacterium]
MKARVFVSFKRTVLDPQGQAVKKALNAHGHPAVSEVRQGKFFEIEMVSEGREQVLAELDTLAREVLVNPVIEEYRIEIPE